MDDIITLTIDKLRLSPHNVRLAKRDTAPMQASLLAQGQLAPLLVHPMRGSKLFGVHAGGTRYEAFRALTERGDLPADHAIQVKVRHGYSDVELEEESLGENLNRKDLLDYETYAGVVRLQRRGRSAQEIADRFGQSLDWVNGALRIGELAKPIFTAFAEGRISRDQARAFGATADTTLQQAVWDELAVGGTTQRSPAEIRKSLNFGNAQAARLLKLVGEDAYLGAGGRIEPDLFADPASPNHRISDETLLRNLAEVKLSEKRREVRDKYARPDLRFESTAPQNDFRGTDHRLSIVPTRHGDRWELPKGKIFARMFVTDEGTLAVDFWWESRTAKHAGSRGATSESVLPKRHAAPAAERAMDLRPAAAIGQQYDNARQIADAAIREEDGLSADAVQIFRSQRRQILRAMLVEDGDRAGTIAQDWILWTQVRLALDPDARPTKLGVGTSMAAEADPEIADPYVRPMPATTAWRQALAEVSRQTFITAADESEALSDFIASDDRMKRLAASVVAGFALQRSLAAEGYVTPVHDRLARHLGIQPGWHDEEVRRHWTPTEPLLAKIPNRQALAIAEPFIEPEPFGAWMKAKAADVTRRLVQLVTGLAVPGQCAERAAAAAVWVHPLLRFVPDPGLPENDDLPPAPAAAKAVA